MACAIVVTSVTEKGLRTAEVVIEQQDSEIQIAEGIPAAPIVVLGLSMDPDAAVLGVSCLR